MPRRSFHNPDADLLPAFGLRDDEFDDHLRSRGKLDAEALAEERAEREAQRRKKEDAAYAAEDADPFDDVELGPRLWRPRARVTTTELCLFAGAIILPHPAIRSNINAWLCGRELETGPRQFDIPEFTERKLGFLPKPRKKDDWEGNYLMKGVRHKLVLKHDKLDPCMTVRLASGKRLVIFLFGGTITNSPGRTEPGILRDLMGRAAGWEHGTPKDIFTVCVPRSSHFRKEITRRDTTEGARRLGLHFLTVERHTGAITGLDALLNLQSGDRENASSPQRRMG